MAACRIRSRPAPSSYMIGTEGGILPGVAVRDNQPVNYDYDRGSATVLNVQNLEGADPAIKGVTILLGPAERADVIVDFSTVAPGTNVILYNDAPTPIPGFQPRYDYYTGNPDLTETGGAPQTLVGFGPNTRTIMQFRVRGTAAATYNLAALQAALPHAYVASQPPPIVPETYYPGAYHSRRRLSCVHQCHFPDLQASGFHCNEDSAGEAEGHSRTVWKIWPVDCCPGV